MWSPRCLPSLPLAVPSLLLPGFAGATPAEATAGAGASPFVLELLAILLPLGFIILCLLVLLRVLRRRFGLVGPEAPLSVVQVLPVGPRERVVVLRSRAGRAFAIGVSAQQVTLLAPLDEEDLGPLDPPPVHAQSEATGPMGLLQRLKVKRP